jgi:hypothetical protein
LDPALDAQHAGNGKPADVGGEHTDPRWASCAARLAVIDDLPTPPLPEAMATMRVVGGMSVSTAFSRALNRARAMTPFFCSVVISPKWTRTSATPGRLGTRRLDVFHERGS